MHKQTNSTGETLPAVVPAGGALVTDAATIEAARRYVEASKAANTRRSYRTAWAQWVEWANANGAAPCPADPAAIALWLAHLADAGAKPSTIKARLAGVAATHRERGHVLDVKAREISAVVAGVRRSHGVAPTKKAPVLTDDLRAMLGNLPPTLAGVRDRAILLIGFGAALRRSELAALDVEDVTITAQGLQVMVRQSKTDQDGEGALIAIHRGRDPRVCPVAALETWLARSGITTGPLFRAVIGRTANTLRKQRLDARTVALIVQRAAEAAGLNGAAYGGHSLRAGLATAAALAGADLQAIMNQTRHKNVDVARGYVRIADIWRDNVTARLL
jgi:integrase